MGAHDLIQGNRLTNVHMVPHGRPNFKKTSGIGLIDSVQNPTPTDEYLRHRP
jgi:hypothetical protein